jgi:hypothetical protein
MFRPHHTALMLAFLFAATAAAQRGGGTGAATPRSEPKTVKEVMVVLTIPGSDAVFKAGGDPPSGAAAWTALRRSATPLVTSADLLLSPQFAGQSREWRALADAHRKATAAAFAAIDKRDAEALSAASDALYETCANCHARFMKQ